MYTRRETDLRGISLLVMGSYPTQATLAFSQLAQLGSFWSHLFLRNRHRLHALTFRKLLDCPILELWPAPSCNDGSVVGEVGPPLVDNGESFSGDEARWRFEGCGSGDGGECGGMVSEPKSICKGNTARRRGLRGYEPG